MMKARIWFSITDYGVFSMTWNLVSDSSCDLRVSSFHSDSVRFETVPLRLLVGEREFLDNDQLSVPELLAAMAAEKSAASSACPSPSASAAGASRSAPCAIPATASMTPSPAAPPPSRTSPLSAPCSPASTARVPTPPPSVRRYVN